MLMPVNFNGIFRLLNNVEKLNSLYCSMEGDVAKYTAILPGVDKSTITAELVEDEDTKRINISCSDECAFGWKTSIVCYDDDDTDKIDIVLLNGILTVSIPKKERSVKKRTLDIK